MLHSQRMLWKTGTWNFWLGTITVASERPFAQIRMGLEIQKSLWEGRRIVRGMEGREERTASQLFCKEWCNIVGFGAFFREKFS